MMEELVISEMTNDQYKALLIRVKNEIYRRSGLNSDGETLYTTEFNNPKGAMLESADSSLFNITAAEWQAAADVIHKKYGQKLINTLLEICDNGDLRLVNGLDPIPKKFDYNQFDALLTALE